MSVMPSQRPKSATEAEAGPEEALLFAAASILREMSNPEAERPIRTIVTSQRSFRLEGHRLKTGTASTGPIVLVFVEAEREQLPEVEELRSRFGLTRKEALVARLIGEDLANEEIAAELSISPHTARHHTERVLAKLEVRSRVHVRAALLAGPTREAPNR